MRSVAWRLQFHAGSLSDYVSSGTLKTTDGRSSIVAGCVPLRYIYGCPALKSQLGARGRYKRSSNSGSWYPFRLEVIDLNFIFLAIKNGLQNHSSSKPAFCLIDD